MKAVFRFVFRFLRAGLLLLGLLLLLFVAAQFTPWPWRAYQNLSQVPEGVRAPPTHVLVMGGSGIPGESGLSRTYFGAQAALRNPQAEVLVALPLGTNESFASRAYCDELRLRGVPAERIQILAGGRNTREQALRLADILSARATSSHVLIVTDPYHIRRTAACIRKAVADRKQEVHLDGLPVFALSIEDPIELIARDLDSSASAPAARPAIPNLGYSFAVLREYSALLYYRLRGWL